jgi:Rieske Fe-S protein
MKQSKTNPRVANHTCGCRASEPTRRDFLAGTSCALIAALSASGLNPEAALALPIELTHAVGPQGTQRSYPLPPGDAVNIDREEEVIIVRQGKHVFAFALSCPHENTALRWRTEDLRFQCPRHESKYQADGTFISGRATRNMDRFAIRLDGQKVIVDLAKLYRSDQQKAEWDAAFVTL